MVAVEQPDPNHPTLVGGLLSWLKYVFIAVETLHCRGELMGTHQTHLMFSNVVKLHHNIYAE